MRDQILDAVSDLLSADETTDRAALKGRLFALAASGQTLPRSDLLLETVAKNMVDEVRALFGPMSLLVPLTEPSRRQVYFAAIAALVRDGRVPKGRAARAEELTGFLTLGNEALLTRAFGSCPPGFVSSLSRLGDHASQITLYLELHELLSEDPALQRAMPAILSRASLTYDLLALLRKLPRTAEGRRVATVFSGLEEYQDFMRAYEAVTGERGRIAPPHLRRLLSGERPHQLVRSLYRGLPFSAPVVTHPDVFYLATARDMERASRDFSNCLDRFVDEAVRGTHQFYVWRPVGGPAAVFSLRSDGRFGWYFDDVKMKKNRDAPVQVRDRLIGVLRKCGVSRTSRVEDLVDRISEDLFDLEELFGDLGDDPDDDLDDDLNEEAA